MPIALICGLNDGVMTFPFLRVQTLAVSRVCQVDLRTVVWGPC